MSKFIKSEFNWDGMYLTYGPDRKFVARFKYRGAPITKTIFVKQLIKNHTPAEYFAAHAAGTAPLEILRLKDQAWHDAVIEKWKNRRASSPGDVVGHLMKVGRGYKFVGNGT